MVDEGNSNHTVKQLRASNWTVEGYHQYRHVMEMLVDFRYSNLMSYVTANLMSYF